VNIVVLVKQVPDTWAERKLSDSDKTLDRASVDVVMNEIDEYAVEEALRLKESSGGEVTVLTMGPERAVETIRKALSMGADKAVHLTDPALAGSDAVQTSYALAQVLSTLEYDLVIAGSEATDSRMSIMTALLAERTGQPQLSGARKVTIADAGIDAGQVGLASAPSQVASFATKPPRSAGQVVKDEGDGGVKIVEFLASQKLV
jgi:electron transfer flavoprotein beta subunit